MGSIIELRGLRKEYARVVALDEANLRITRGDIVGLIGPNGAGKTTMLRILATVLEPTSGSVQFEGVDLWDDPVAVRKKMGFMPDFFQVYRALSVREFLTFFAIAHGMKNPQRDARVEEVTQSIGLTEKIDEKFWGLSRGIVQRLGLGSAIMHRPELLLLDEPASGLDPLARRVMFDVLREYHQAGTTIVISSHILGELSELCTSVVMMDRGQLKMAGTTEAVIDELLPQKLLELTVTQTTQPQAREILAQSEHVGDLADKPNGVIQFAFCGTTEDRVALLRQLIIDNVGVVSLSDSATSLHEAYFALTEQNGGAS